MRRRTSAALTLMAISLAAAAAAQDAPGYRVVLVDQDRYADRAFVNVRHWDLRRPSLPSGWVPGGEIAIEGPTDLTRTPCGGGPHAMYTLVDAFPIEQPQRLCAVPASWVIASRSTGALGPRQLRDARAVSGAVFECDGPVTELMALFDSPEVACAEPFDVPEATRELAARHVEGIEDTMRVVGIDGRTLRLSLVQTRYELARGAPITVPPSATGGRGPLPPPRSACGCRAARRGTSAGSLLVVLGLALASRRGARS